MRLFFLLALTACAGNAEDVGPDAGTNSPPPGTTDAGVDAPAGPAITVQRGVDRASAFTLTEARTLKTDHGVRWTGVYIGGPCNAGSGWTKSLVTSLATNLDWTFMPIYVGQQSSSICGAHTLTASQGTTDGQAAAAKMKDFGWEPNRDIPVVLDLEAGAYSSSPSGALAYSKAWRDAVRTAG